MFDLLGIDNIPDPSRLDHLDPGRLTLVQRALAICGQPISAIDGQYGSNTRTAWAGFLAERGVPDREAVAAAARDALRDRAAAIATLCLKPAPDRATVKNSIRAACADMGIGLPNQAAYVLATANWETNATFKPVREAYWIPNAEQWRKTHLTRYYPYYGRGYVQLTWLRHYKFYGDVFGLDLLDDPDAVINHEMSLFVLVHGFKMGRFTGHKLVEFVSATRNNFRAARACINGTDHDTDIAKLAQGYLTGASSVAIGGKGNVQL